MAFSNPFARDDTEETRRNIAAYRIFTLISWLLVVITAIVHQATVPHAFAAGATPFTPNGVFVAVYWIVMYISQAGYIWHLFSRDDVLIKSAAAVGSHFILFNVLQFIWIMLWARGHFIVAEVIQIINFLHMAMAYFRNPRTQRLIHLPVFAMPLTWTFFSLYWNGAVMVHCHGLACRIVANVFIWTFLGFAGFYLLAYKDYYVGFSMAFLIAGLGVGQFFTKVIAFQWIFAFAIMGTVFVLSCAVAVPGIFGFRTGAEASGNDRERAPLLQEP